jgi:1-Cys peroxiredoxin 6
MGAGASAGILAAVKTSTKDDLAAALKDLPAADKEKLLKSMAPAAAAGAAPVGGTVSSMETGTAFYMSLYPEGSTDGGLRLGNIVPDFSCETTQGTWESFHTWKKGKWAILFSHPADFTPVCTTEIGRLALKYDELSAMDCLVATLSVDPVKSHTEWLTDVVAHCENKIEIKFPIIGDADRVISTKYGMIDPGTSKDQGLPLTIRAVFFVNPENKLMLTMNYPACVGRSMDEIVRCVKALQLSYEKSVATPANWPFNHQDIPTADGGRTTDFEGSVFLLPTVSDEEAKKNYPGFHTCAVPSEKSYLRLVKIDDVAKGGDKMEKVNMETKPVEKKEGTTVGATVSAMESGTKLYMSLYPEAATDNAIRLGNIVPDFSCETTQGPWESFHEWKKGKWAILFSHPADFTPVCTTEIGRLALKYDELTAMDCLVATLSVDPVKSHTEWLTDVVAHCENKIEVKFPIIGDADRSISMKYGMIDPGTSKDQGLPLTIRAVFIVNPENKLMLSLNYPACVGRSMDEIVRCVKALQLSYEKSVATPANWPNNHADIPFGDGRTSDFKGSVFLLPTVSAEEAKTNYPGFHTCDVPSDKAYLRLVKLEDVS